MATKKEDKNKNKKKDNGKPEKIKSALNGETGHFIGGLICLMFGVYMFLAFTSFLSAGGADQSVTGYSPTGETEVVQNHTGPAGARLAEFLMNGCFGLPAYLIVVVLLIAGTKLMKAYNFTVWKWFLGCMAVMYWLSVTLGFAFGETNSFVQPGGMHGYNVSRWIESYIGVPGLILLLLFCGILIGVAIRRQTMEVVRKVLHPQLGKTGEKKDDAEMAEAAAMEEAVKVVVEEEVKAEETIEETPERETVMTEVEEEAVEEKKEEKKKWSDKLMPGGLLGKMFGKKHKEEKADDVEEKESTEESGHKEDVKPYESSDKEDSYAEEVYSDDVNYTDNAIELPLDDYPETAKKIIEEERISHTIKETTEKNDEPEFEIEETKEEETVRGDLSVPYNPRLDLELYKFPTLDLLKTYPDDGPSIDMEEQTANKNRIIQVLRSFGIEISSIKANVGPTVTLYEITPAEGVRISKIRNLEDDIALSLSALGIRIIAPIPGKGTIGIEVPNATPKIVPMSSVLASKKFQESTYELPIALGKTITNEVFMVDLA